MLTQEELYILLQNLRNVFAGGDPEAYLVPDDALISFLKHCFTNVGEAYFRTPRSIIKAFLDMLSVLEQSPSIKWDSLVENLHLEEDRPTDMNIEINDDDDRKAVAGGLNTGDMEEDELGSFKL